MIQDIQAFEAIFRDEDTALESVDLIALDLAEVDGIGVNTGIKWVNNKPKCNIILKSGNTFVLLEAFENIFCLWQRYKKEQKKAALIFRYN